MPVPNAKVISNNSNVNTSGVGGNTTGATLGGQVDRKHYDKKVDKDSIPDIFNDDLSPDTFVGFDSETWADGFSKYAACYKGKTYAPNERNKATALCKPGSVKAYSEVKDCMPCGNPAYTKCRTHFRYLCKLEP